LPKTKGIKKKERMSGIQKTTKNKSNPHYQLSAITIKRLMKKGRSEKEGVPQEEKERPKDFCHVLWLKIPQEARGTTTARGRE